MTDGKTLPVEVLQQVVEKTDGVPLLVEEMTKAVRIGRGEKGQRAV
jgi:predicted ATPase